MGVTISCKKTGKSLDFGFFGFNRLRDKVAELHFEEFGEHLKLLSSPSVMVLSGNDRNKFFDEYDDETSRIVRENKLNRKIVDFCLQPDCDGKIRYGACKAIYEAVKDYDDNILYGYAGRPDCAKFVDFKELLKECYETKSDLVWF